MKTLLKLIATTCLLILLPINQAWSATWYQVELLVFANEDPDALDDEFWPENLSVPEKAGAIPLGSTNNQKAYSRLSGNNLLLTAEKNRIAKHDGFRVLFHGGWKQPVSTSKRKAKPVYIKAGQVLDNGKYELEGYVTIDRGRFLHFRPELFHSRQLSSRESNILRTFEQQNVEQLDANNVAPMPAVNTTDTGITSNGLNIPDFLTVELTQGRRMRSKEVHYLDHPLMGMLVLMIPLKQQVPAQ